MAADKSKKQQNDKAYDDSEFDTYDSSNVGSAGGQAVDTSDSDMEDSYDSKDFYVDNDKVS